MWELQLMVRFVINPCYAEEEAFEIYKASLYSNEESLICHAILLIDERVRKVFARGISHDS
jgi:hypothetical protein